MKKIIFVAGVFGCFSNFSYAGVIDNSDVTVFGTVFNTNVPANTVDNDLSTFWHGTNDIQIGQTNFLAYRFSAPANIHQIDFWDDFHNGYFMGELDIQKSSDSTDGQDGLWTNVDHIAGDFNPANGDFSRNFSGLETDWVRLYMTYEGRAAHGSSPAFYLSEIDFHGTVTPEPASMALFGLGGAALAGYRIRKRNAGRNT